MWRISDMRRILDFLLYLQKYIQATPATEKDGEIHLGIHILLKITPCYCNLLMN